MGIVVAAEKLASAPGSGLPNFCFQLVPFAKERGTCHSHSVPLAGEDETAGRGCLRSHSSVLLTEAGHPPRQRQPFPQQLRDWVLGGGCKANVAMPRDRHLLK